MLNSPICFQVHTSLILVIEKHISGEVVLYESARLPKANINGGLESGVLLLLNIEVLPGIIDFTPDRAGLMWNRGRITLGDDTNNVVPLSPSQIFPIN